MYSLANCLISIYRGTTLDEFGDVVANNGAPIRSGVQAFLSEGGAMPHDLNEQVPRVVRMVNLIVQSDTDIQTHDKIVDETNGATYWVRYVEFNQSPGQKRDLKVNLERVIA